jgi:hypothetical protein
MELEYVDSNGKLATVSTATPLPSNVSVQVNTLSASDNTIGRVKVTDGVNFASLVLDGTLYMMPSIDITHARVHAGDAYEVGNWVSFSGASAGTTLTVGALTTGSKITHLKPRIYLTDAYYTSAPTRTASLNVTIFENPTITLGASVTTPSNRNRNSTNTSLNALYTAPTGISGGTSLGSTLVLPGNSTSLGNTYDANNEFLLKPNATYVWSFINPTDSKISGNLIYRFNYYEI